MVSDKLLLRLAFAVLILGSLALRLSLALGPLENIDGHCMPDDTYLFLDIARSIADGDGPLYGRDFTNGFQPLFAFLLAPIFWFSAGGDTPVHATLVMLTVFDTLSVLALAWLAIRLCNGSWYPAVIVAAAWACNHNVLRNTLNGMETAVALLWLVVAIATHRALFQEREVTWSGPRALLAGASVGLAMLTRVDSILLVPAFGAFVLWRVWRRQLRIAMPWRTAVVWGLGVVVLFAPWLVYSYAYTGDVYPVSGRAVRFQADAHYVMFPQNVSTTWIHLRRAGGEIFRGNFVLLTVLAGILAAMSATRAGRRNVFAAMRPLSALWIHALLVFSAYAIYIHGTWFFHRYLYPVMLPITLGTAVAFHVWIREMRPSRQTLATLAVSTVLILGSTMTNEFATVTETGRDGNFGYRAIGLWVRDRFPAGTVIGAKQSGAMGYYADECTVLNLDGVVNRSAFEALQDGRMLTYLGKQRIDYYVLWSWGAEFLRFFSEKPIERDLVKFEDVPEIHSWGDHGTNQFGVYRLDD